MLSRKKPNDKIKEEISAAIFNLTRAKLMLDQKNDENFKKFLQNALNRFQNVINEYEKRNGNQSTY